VKGAHEAIDNFKNIIDVSTFIMRTSPVIRMCVVRFSGACQHIIKV
jgi:hypothetical protein